MLRSQIRVHHSDTAPPEPVLQVLGQQQPATDRASCREDDRIPRAQSVVHDEPCRLQDDVGSRIDHRIGVAPREDGLMGVPWRSTRLAHQHVEQLAEHLSGDDDVPDGCRFEPGVGRRLTLPAVHPFGVGQDVRVEGDLHGSAYSSSRVQRGASMAGVWRRRSNRARRADAIRSSSAVIGTSRATARPCDVITVVCPPRARRRSSENRRLASAAGHGHPCHQCSYFHYIEQATQRRGRLGQRRWPAGTAGPTVPI